jgi:hypothetical protein
MEMTIHTYIHKYIHTYIHTYMTREKAMHWFQQGADGDDHDAAYSLAVMLLDKK